MTRRFFIAGAASFGAFGGLRFAANAAFAQSAKPRLVFGVISDVHILAEAGAESCGRGCAYFKRTLEWYRDHGVDAVMIVGDLADNGFSTQLQAFADTWFSVFPNDLAPDGRKVEKLFVYGNHDWEGKRVDDHKSQKFMRADFAKCWERIIRESYEPIYRKTIKGYDFIGQHWDRQGWFARCRFERIEPFMAEHRKSLNPKMPFFYFQHPHLKDTCYGPWADGHDTGIATRVLSAWPNAIAFSGHSHLTLTDERTIWQGAFTSVGTGSLSYTGGYSEFSAEGGCENDRKGDWAANAKKLLPAYDTYGCRQGMLWNVYDDAIAVRRLDFSEQETLELGPQWVMPLPSAEPKPFEFALRAKKVAAPKFAPGARLLVKRVMTKSRGGKNPKNAEESIPSVEKPGFELAIPPAEGRDGARTIRYDVTASAAGKSVKKRVLAAGFNHAPAHKKASDLTCIRFAEDELPVGDVTFSVVPINSFGRAGKPLVAEVCGETPKRT